MEVCTTKSIVSPIIIIIIIIVIIVITTTTGPHLLGHVGELDALEVQDQEDAILLAWLQHLTDSDTKQCKLVTSKSP
jgi:hypothetical protein